ncbi:MAG: phosphatidylserine decarboxylase [Acidobacteria bacterium]|nr:phosphatidylserine decarboxylase [Acidobacteriota bacterium]
MPSRTLFAACVVLGLLLACEAQPSKQAAPAHQPVVAELVTMLDARQPLRTALETAIERAAVEGVSNLDEFYAYIDELVTWVPVERELAPRAIKFHFIIGQAPDDQLNEDPEFAEWMSRLAIAWEHFLDTSASAAQLDTFIKNPDYHIDDYAPAPSGWLTFNQFFARSVRAGKRPVSDPRDDAVIVSPADAVFKGAWPIGADSQITVKGVTWPIAQLLADSPYTEAFRNGVYTHSFLYVDDYHRFHTPVAGEVKDVRNIHGRIYLDVQRKEDGELEVIDGETYQFNQERGLIVLDSPKLGLVAVLPIGMSFVSSVQLNTDVGANLRKGDEFGYFTCGGSDVVILFSRPDITFEADIGTKYLQGQRIATMK